MLLDSAEREVGRWWRTCVSANFSPLFRLCLQNELRQLRVARGLAKEASIRLLAKAMSSQELAEVGAAEYTRGKLLQKRERTRRELKRARQQQSWAEAVANLTRLQAHFRGVQVRHRIRSAVVLQSFARMVRERHAFVMKQFCASLIQGLVRGAAARRVSLKQRVKLITDIRLSLLKLWEEAGTPLEHRS